MSAVTITVIYALPGSATEIELSLPAGTTVAEALNRSGIASRHPEVDLARCPVGIFGRRVERGRILSDGDRVEIYRPLVAEPRDARRQRAHGSRHG